ncbi:MAG: sigma-70 family RNA polymerase sigma factor [Clostridia bacterium]|nr:sigma-70 family RNA polymerase sigma factor [Clostridia bacterium]
MDDSRIIELFFERSEQAIVELSKKYGETLRKIALNILKNNPDAEECVNDAYLGAWNTIPPENPNPLLTYICRIVRNISIKRYHRNTTKKRNSYYDVALDELEACLSSGSTVYDELNAKELTDLLDEFLSGLDKTNRIMFVRRYWFSDSISDIATKLKMNNHAVTVRLSRTRDKLRRFLSKKGVTI